MGRHIACAVLALACGAAAAVPHDGKVLSVEINGVRDPEMKSYRAVVAGLDVFDEYHRQMAPGAPGLRFLVVERGGWCGARANDEYIAFGYRAAAPLAGAMLRHGDRTQPVEFSDSSYQVRIGDTSWPDDTLVELQYEEAADAVALPAG